MYIKQIIIQGFKSYKDQTVIEPFSPGLNVIVGRNGSGKSNFFAAIRFVLSDAYTQMGREERQALLHEGSGSAVMSAYVEVIFDNSDERFPTGKPELVLRRTIGLKKDEYTLDRKNATKSDVTNLLESAGFSRSNPYYIVPQGRVTTLTNMKDPERLNLLKEVAGTQVYEARRAESLRIMQETDNKRSKIDDLLAYIKERLQELEEEKEELRKYQEKDREHRSLQYTILDREKAEYTRALATIDDQRSGGVDETDTNRETFLEREEEIAEIEAQTSELRQQIEYLTTDKRQLDDERKDAQRDKAKTELDVQSLTTGQSAAQKAKTKHDAELREVQRLIKDRENELTDLMPNYNNQSQQESIIRSQLDEAEATRRRLYAKQGRSAEFTSKRERDEYLKKEIEDFNMQLATRKAVAMQTGEEIKELEHGISSLDAEAVEIRNRIENRGDDLQSISAEAEKAKETRDELMDKRRELWREENRLQSVVQAAQKELETAEHSLQRMTDRNTWQGIKNVRRIKEEHELDGVYGTLAELFEVNELYRTAVEVTAGQSLFHYVVDSDETATKVLDILQRERGGRVTFMPLNRLRPRTVNLPKSADAVQMLSRITYDRKFEKAFQQVFGKTVICPSLSIAAQFARSHGVSAITPSGDRADKKGALTGGYHDPRQSRLEGARREARCREELQTQREQHDTIKGELTTLDQQITKAVSELQKIEQRRLQLDSSYGPLRQELRNTSMELQRRREALEVKQRAKENIETEERRLGKEQEAYEAELATDFKKSLSQSEEHQLETLGSTVQHLRKQLSELSSNRSDLEARKRALEVELGENLRLRLDQLTTHDVENGNDGDISGGNASSRLKDRHRDLKRVNKILEDLEKKVLGAERMIEKAIQQLAEVEKSKAEKQQQQEELARAMERHQKRMEKSMQKKALLTENLAECNRGLRDLGVVPEDAFKKYDKWESDKAIKRLHVVKESLKKYSHVNKKAFEQYNNFTRQRETLTKRRGELDSSQRSIEELIEHLDQRKDEAIERTFKQVSKEFATVFEKLVPAGKGRLIIQRKSDRQVQDDQDGNGDSEGEGRESVENYTGVGISVSFNSKHDEQQRIQQLSGGQKSLCALALVFAIQQCDPAPFYLFDEIDANLDAQYRTAVAQMLKTLSEAAEGGGQFICTTFRPEMVLVAEKCYGVTYTNKTSSIDVVDREAALEFVEGATGGK